MEKKYKFGKIEDKLLGIIRRGEFEKAREAKAGANVNATDEYGESMLEYALTEFSKNRAETTGFFIDAGFDLSKYGARCLNQLIYSQPDRALFDSAKVILQSGVDLKGKTGEAFLEAVGTEESYQRCCCNAPAVENIFYAYYELLERYIKGKEWRRVSVWQDALGKTVDAVLLKRAGKQPPYINDGEKRLFDGCLFFLHKDGTATVVEGNPNIFVAPAPKAGGKETVDISASLGGVSGEKITDISFKAGRINVNGHIYPNNTVIISFSNGSNVIVSGAHVKENGFCLYYRFK
ncbi:MAG: hypothetical protein IJS65_08475 [Clostridia bacterium]|nr:hypothetical protein [Clostridia bacterium]